MRTGAARGSPGADRSGGKPVAPRCSGCPRRARAARRPDRRSAARACAARRRRVVAAGERERRGERAHRVPRCRDAVGALAPGSAPPPPSIVVALCRRGRARRCRARAARPASRACRPIRASPSSVVVPRRARRAAACGWRCSSSPAARPRLPRARRARGRAAADTHLHVVSPCPTEPAAARPRELPRAARASLRLGEQRRSSAGAVAGARSSCAQRRRARRRSRRSRRAARRDWRARCRATFPASSPAMRVKSRKPLAA